MTSLETIDRFLAAFLASDGAAAATLVTEGFQLITVPMGPGIMTGREALCRVLEMPSLGFAYAPQQSEHRVVRSVEQGQTVMHERIDRFQFDGQWHELPIASTFTFREGLIATQTDYFDLGTYMRIRAASQLR
ncbi:MAG: nuclear transport factor 2 family protein [Sphingomonadales bacterium]|nr:nuclear transport factor 2 family protein [Sphingomonadales bacterium]